MFATPEFWSALAAIVVIDLVLAGDNAIVIALAARSLPKAVQRRAIIWGTVGAVIVRASLTVAVLGVFTPTALGTAWIVAQSVVVAAFAAAQWTAADVSGASAGRS